MSFLNGNCILQPSLENILDMKNYILNEVNKSNESNQGYSVFKIMPSSNWSYQFNEDLLNYKLYGTNRFLTLFNIELFDELSFEHYYDSYIKSNDINKLDILIDLKIENDKTIELYDLYKIYVNTNNSTIHNETEYDLNINETQGHGDTTINYVFKLLNIDRKYKDKLKNIIEKYIIGFNLYLLQLNILSNKNSMKDHYSIIEKMYESRTNLSDITISLELKNNLQKYNGFQNIEKLSKSDKIKLKAKKFKSYSLKQFKSKNEMEQLFQIDYNTLLKKKVNKMSQEQNILKSSQMNGSQERIQGVRTTRNMIKKLYKNNNGDTSAIIINNNDNNHSDNGNGNTNNALSNNNNDDNNNVDQVRFGDYEGSAYKFEYFDQKIFCHICNSTQLEESRVVQCNSCDIFLHKDCIDYEIGKAYWSCPYCESLNWLKFRPSLPILDSHCTYNNICDNTDAINMEFNIAPDYLEEYFWQLVQFGVNVVNVYHAAAQEEHISGFQQRFFPIESFQSSEMKGKALRTSTVYVDSVYSTQGIHQAIYKAPTLHFIHKGAKKTWYVIRSIRKLILLLKLKAPTLFGSEEFRFEQLNDIPLVIHPQDLIQHDVDFDVVEQNVGEFLYFQPGVATFYISHGVSLGESIVLTLPTWAPYAELYFKKTKNPLNCLNYGDILEVLVGSLFTYDIEVSKQLFIRYKNFIDNELNVRYTWENKYSNKRFHHVDKEKRCFICNQTFHCSGLEHISEHKFYCTMHSGHILSNGDIKEHQAVIHYVFETSVIEKKLDDITKTYHNYKKWVNYVNMIMTEALFKEIDYSDVEKLISKARTHKFTNNRYFKILDSIHNCQKIYNQFLNSNLDVLTKEDLFDLKENIVDVCPIRLDREDVITKLFDDLDKVENHFKSYKQGTITGVKLEEICATVKISPINRDIMETVTNVLKNNKFVNEVRKAVRKIAKYKEDRLENLISSSELIHPSPKLNKYISIIKQVLAERQLWKNEALDLLDKSCKKTSIEKWDSCRELGKTIDDYGKIKKQLREQISMAKKFEEWAENILGQTLTGDDHRNEDLQIADAIGSELKKADSNILIELPSYKSLYKEYEDARIWLRLADLGFVYPESGYQLFSILMPKVFNRELSEFFVPLLEDNNNICLMTINLRKDKRDLLRDEYQSLLQLRNYHQIIKHNESNKMQIVCFCKKNVHSNLISCYLCTNFYHEKCIIKELRKRELQLNQAPHNLSAIQNIDLFICTKCSWGKRPQIPQVQGHMLDVLHEVKLNLPEGVALLKCLQRTTHIQEEIKSFLASRDVSKLIEMKESIDRENLIATESMNIHSLYYQNQDFSLSSSIGDQRKKNKRKSTLIPRVDNDSINKDDVKNNAIELLNKGLLIEINIPELSPLLSFIRKLDKEFGKCKIIIDPSVKKREIQKKSPHLVTSDSPDPGTPPVQKKLAKMMNTSYKASPSDVLEEKRIETASSSKSNSTKIKRKRSTNSTSISGSSNLFVPRTDIGPNIQQRIMSIPQPKSSGSIVQPKAGTSGPSRNKKKKTEKKELCELEDCLEPTGDIAWVQCDKCTRWFHFVCVGIAAISEDDPYICTYCCSSVLTSNRNDAILMNIDNEDNENAAISSLLSLSRGYI